MSRRLLQLLVAISVLTFLLQAVRVSFSTLFGIIYDEIFEEQISAWLPISNLLVVAAVLWPLLARVLRGTNGLAVCAALAALSRIPLTINDATIRYWASLILLASAGVYLALLLSEQRSLTFAGLVGALGLDQVLGAAGDTLDISLRPGWMPVQIVWGLVMAGLAIWLARSEAPDEPPAGLTLPGGLALGAWLFVETSLLALPNGIARWTGTPYGVIAPILAGLTLLALLPPVQGALRQIGASRQGRLALALLLAIGLMLGYFLKGLLPGIALLVAQGASLALLLLILDHAPSRQRGAGGALALGLLMFVVLNFFNAFAFTYPYLLPFMRGMGWTVYLAAAALIGLGALLAAPRASEGIEPPLSTLPAAAAGILALALVIILTWPRTVSRFPDDGVLRVATYNIHYGYDDVWHMTLEDIAQTIADEEADIVAMQEVDTGRMTSYLADNAYFLARRLDMNVLYLPTVEHLTGIAILYRDPVILTDTALITSQQEQTGIVLAQVDVGGEPLYAYGIWMGLSDEDTLAQIDEALAFIGENSPAVFGGDFNTEPGSPVYRAIEEAGFIDPFVALNIDPMPFTSPAPEPTSRIDFVWVRNLSVVDAWVPDSQASDHRIVVIEVQMEP